MRIPYAPLQKANSFGREWLQWFSSVSQGIAGLWGVQRRKFQLNTAIEPDISYLSYTGRELTFLVQWNDGVSFNNSKLVLDKEDLSMVGGCLLLINNGALVNVLELNPLDETNKEILIPDTTLAGKVIIQGTMLSRVDRS